MSKLRSCSKYLSIAQSPFIDDTIVDFDCIRPFCPSQIANVMHYLLFCACLLTKGTWT